MSQRAAKTVHWIMLAALVCGGGLVTAHAQDQAGDASPAPDRGEIPTHVRVSQGVTSGLLIKKVNPVYPKKARKKHIQGVVTLRAKISKEGDIVDLSVVSGEPMLAKAAVEAVKQWKYKPYFLKGEPVEVETQIMVNFRLEGG